MSKSEIEFASTQAERLAKLICEAHSKLNDEYLLNDNILTYAQQLEYEADHLIANGVTIPVRCKECKHRETLWGEVYCGFFDASVVDNGFCNFGERRTDES